MRVTNSLFYTNAANDYQRNMQELYKTNTQISSGLKIQNSFEDSGTYVDAMRLNYEVATLDQVKESTSKAQTYANNTDQVFNQFTDALTQFKTKLIQSANETNSETSLNALANELQVLRDHMVSLGNTSINGKYLFSGSAVKIKPVSSDGTYNGNAGNLEATIGSGVKLPYNINGQDLFLGSDSEYNKTLSTNVQLFNQIKLNPTNGNPEEVYINENSTIRELVGDSDDDLTNNGNVVFYLSGRKSDGSTFSNTISLSQTAKMSELTTQIGQEYGNTSTNKVVDVNINDSGQIEIKDLNNGNALLQMNIFGAVDRSATGGTDGNASSIDLSGATSIPPSTDIIEFIKNDYTTTLNSSTIRSINYEKRDFGKDGNKITSNVSQIVKSTNTFASNETKLIDVAGIKTFDDISVIGDETTLNLIGKNNSGNAFNAQIEFSNDASVGTRFTLDGGTTYYTVFDSNGNRTKADDMTYKQLSDIAGMLISDELPANTNGTFDEYIDALKSSKKAVDVGLDYKGKLQIEDKNNTPSQIEFSMFDSNANSATDGSALTFMANDAITTENPKIDFYKDLDNMIEAVRSGQYKMDSGIGDPRNLGIENSIARLDHLMTHITKEQTKIGSYSNALSQANDRSSLLSINVQTVRSDVIDVDIGEAYMKFNQLSNSYQAMLSTVAKINSMTLLNYM